MKLAVLISGRGSNLQSIIDACADPEFPAQIEIVISNKPDAYGLTRAEKAGIKTSIVSHKDYTTREAFEDALQNVLDTFPIDLICLAGFMRVLTEDFVNRWDGRMINIHPSLLPKFKGLNTHERAIDAGEKESGCTIHFVIPDMDEGPIILQRKVSIETGETAQSLAEKVLIAEHEAYPEAIRLLSSRLLKS
ncbi:MAG: phosphoribosylglycinamide formyltransferase [Micavibrio aeruginosavorus]|uniref:Phosphoribosylglycinamide formyltransferase n=1 Tax=Micavibrio aeruginosavorus TaxID=349221 RepID=A0A2W5FPX6_9BACT|nr:MAG: phosphoribosylglycinamide formyltransferase [Micavibrio aeruginosavorus]